jgi:phage I-like protein
MNIADTTTALMSAQFLPSVADGGGAPEWIHLLPAGVIGTGDKRGPYRALNVEQIIADSFLNEAKLPVDINHSIHLRAPKGEEAPAVGWIVAMQARSDGLWGKVEWTAQGAELVTSRAYKGISPVIRHTADKTITSIECVSLVNKPNLRGLTALHQQQDTPLMDWTKFLANMLGLPETATDDDIKSALKAKMKGDKETAMQSQLSEIGVALGLGEDSEAADILVAAQSAVADDATDETFVALQAELTQVTTALNTLKDDRAKDAATAFVEGAIKMGRVGVKPMKDRYISMHMKDASGTEELISAMPALSGSGTSIIAPVRKDGEVALNSEQLSIAKMLGQDPKDYAATLAEEQAELENN